MPEERSGPRIPRVRHGDALSIACVVMLILLSSHPLFASSHPCFSVADAKALAQQGIQDVCTIRGVVTLPPGANSAAPGEFIIQDNTGGLLIEGDAGRHLQLWETLEVRGKDTWERRSQTGVVLAGVPGIRVIPEAITSLGAEGKVEGRLLTLSEAKDGQFVDDLVRVRGKVLRIVLGDAKEGQGEATDYFVLGPSPELWVYVKRPRSEPSWIKNLAEPGSEVEATGVSIYSKTSHDYRVRLRTQTDIAIIKPSSWLTRSHILAAIGIVLLVVFVGFSWILLLKRTIRKRTEEIQEREQMLRQAQKMDVLNQLAGGIAHDFNNVLMAISGYSELLKDMTRDEQQKQIVDEILKASGRGAGLTRQLLAFSRRNPASPKLIDMNRLVDELLPMVTRLVGEDIRVTAKRSEDEAIVRADRVQLEQVLINLVANARDAMPAGGLLSIEVDVVAIGKARYVLPAGKYVRLTVQDTGCGMDAATVAKAFEPFFTTKDVGKGTGLGLSTVYGIIRQNEGDIAIESKPGHGTTFTILIPFKAGKVEKVESPSPMVAASNGGFGRILIVEDEQQIRESLAAQVERMGYDVSSAASASDAIQLAKGRDFELLITDIVMPEMSGIELFDALSASRPSLKVIFMSGYSERVVEYGARRLRGPMLKKPFQLTELAKLMRAVLPTPHSRDQRDAEQGQEHA